MVYNCLTLRGTNCRLSIKTRCRATGLSVRDVAERSLRYGAEFVSYPLFYVKTCLYITTVFAGLCGDLNKNIMSLFA